MKKKGYRTLGEFAAELGVHRNSIHYYLSGHGVFPGVVESILDVLGLEPSEVLEEKKAESLLLDKIAPTIDALHMEFPDVTFVLFGSRAKGAARGYSDWDIGVFSAHGLPHETYRRIARRKDDLTENLPFFVDVVNLNRAGGCFLSEASRHWEFLAGRLQDWIELQRKAAV